MGARKVNRKTQYLGERSSLVWGQVVCSNKLFSFAIIEVHFLIKILRVFKFLIL